MENICYKGHFFGGGNQHGVFFPIFFNLSKVVNFFSGKNMVFLTFFFLRKIHKKMKFCCQENH